MSLPHSKSYRSIALNMSKNGINIKSKVELAKLIKIKVKRDLSKENRSSNSFVSNDNSTSINTQIDKLYQRIKRSKKELPKIQDTTLPLINTETPSLRNSKIPHKNTVPKKPPLLPHPPKPKFSIHAKEDENIGITQKLTTNKSTESLLRKSLSRKELKKSNSFRGSKAHSEKRIKFQSNAMSQAGRNEDMKTKENQDSYIIMDKVLDLQNYHIYGVMDGHGVNGHLVSQFLAGKIHEFFSNQSNYKSHKRRRSLNSTDNNNQTIFNEDKVYDILQHNNFDIIHKFIKDTNTELENSKFDVHFSGSTCVLIFKIGKNLIISNTGDSRAILIKQNSSLTKQNWEVEPLTIDHKPEIKTERDRIEKEGGRVEQCKDENGISVGVFRVWEQNEEYPGIAMSRSIGYFVAKKIGVTYKPDITVRTIDPTYRSIVLASDGIWDFLSNEKVMEIVKPYYESGDSKGAVKELVAKARELWEEENDIIDDITVIVIFFGNNNNALIKKHN